MDETRRLLDELMGQDRNMNLREREKHKPRRKTFTDKGICRAYICGFCPHEEFRRTKMDMGDCENEHDERLREEWEALEDREKERYGFEEELLRWLERLLSDLRKRIAQNEDRLQALEKPVLLPDDAKHLEAMTQQINQAIKDSELLGEQGNVDACQAALNQAEAIKQQRRVYEQQAYARSRERAGASSKLVQKVCQVSGLIINDEESRLRDHYGGRNYNSWKKLHAVHAKLLEARDQRRASRSRLRERSRSPRDTRSGYDGRRRERSRERGSDRYRSSSGRDRYDRDRDYRSRDFDRRRDQERSGSRERNRRREGDRSAGVPEAGPEPGEVPVAAAQ